MDQNTVAILLIISALLPVAINFAKRDHFSNAINSAIAIAVYIAVGVVTPFINGQAITFDNLVIDIGIVLGGGTAAYTAFWKNQINPPASTSVVVKTVVATIVSLFR